MNTSPIAQHYVELRLLRYVIAVAEELHFGRAAKHLNLSAPALSKQVKDLEAAVGYLLFERRTREVTLTPAGTVFVAEARQALDRVERAVVCGYAVSRGETGVLSLGYSPWFRPSLLLATQAAFVEKLPKMRLALHSAYSTTQINLILKGTLAAGIVELPANEEGLEIHCVWHEKLVVALPERHPLATRAEIAHEDLVDEPAIWIAKSLNPSLHQSILESCQRFGFLPRIAYEVNTVSEILDLVTAGAGIAFVKSSSVERGSEGRIVFRELRGRKLFIETGIAYRPDNNSEALRVLVALLREQAN